MHSHDPWLNSATSEFRRGFVSQRRAARAVAMMIFIVALLAAVTVPAMGQSVSFAGLQVTVPASGLNRPYSVASDAAGDVFIADTANNRVVEVPLGCASASCQLTIATGLNSPEGVVVDGAGDAFIGDTHNNRVVEVPAGCTSSTCWVILGSGLNEPAGMALDRAGDLYIADYNNNRVVEIPAGCTSSTCQTTVGTGLNGPGGEAIDAAGDVFVADYNTSQVVEIPAGCTSSTCQTTVGSGLSYPAGVALDGAGDVFIDDSGNNRVVEVPVGCTSSACQITVGSGLSEPLGLAVDEKGDVLIADTNNSRVLEYFRTSVNFGVVSVGSSSTLTLTYNINSSITLGSGVNIASQGQSTPDFATSVASSCTGSQTAGSTCTVTVAFAPQAPGLRQGAVEVVDSSGNIQATTLIEGVSTSPVVAFVPGTQTTVGSGLTGPFAVVDLAGNVYVANTGGSSVLEIPVGCTTASCQITIGGGFSGPQYIAVDGAGNVFVADTGNNRIAEAPQGCTTSACVETVVTGLNSPEGVAVDGADNLFIGDTHNNRVLEVPFGCTTAACQFTIGGGFGEPAALTVDASDNVYVADYNNNRIVKVASTCASSTCETTVGTGFNGPTGVAVDAAGDVFVANYNSNSVVEVPAGCASSSCQTAVGSGFSLPVGLGLDGAGDIFIADSGNNRIVEIVRSQAPSLSFPATPVGSTSAAQTVTIQNVGNGSLDFTGIAASTNFTVVAGSTSCSTSSPLGLGASCSVAIACAPTVTGSLSGTLTLTDNALNGLPATQQVPLSCSSSVPTPIVPYVQVNDGAWRQESTATVVYGASVNLGPQPLSGGTWSWTGPHGFTSTARQINNIPLTVGTNVFVATFTNTSGAQSTQTFTITELNGTPIVPYIQVNWGNWQQTSSVTVTQGWSVNLGPQPLYGGSWSWTGPNGFRAWWRQIDNIPLSPGVNIFVATFTNNNGQQSTQVFTINVVVPTPITPYIQVNGGAWQQTNYVNVRGGASVNLGPQPLSGGTWSWVGPFWFSSTSRQINNIPLGWGTNYYVATFTNSAGAQSTETFTINVY